MRNSSRRAGSAPVSRAATLREDTGRSVLSTEKSAFAPRETGRKSRLAAARFEAAKSCPAALKSFSVVSSVSQPENATWPALLSGVLISKFSRLQLVMTTPKG